MLPSTGMTNYTSYIGIALIVLAIVIFGIGFILAKKRKKKEEENKEA